jgi:hypothetical protein
MLYYTTQSAQSEIGRLQFAITPLTALAICKQPHADVTEKANSLASTNLAFRLRCVFVSKELTKMADVIFISIAVIFFVISWLYVRGCDRL